MTGQVINLRLVFLRIFHVDGLCCAVFDVLVGMFVGMFVDFMALKDEYDCWIYYFMNIINIIKYKN